MDWFRGVIVLCGMIAGILSVLKAWLEWKLAKMKHNAETSENGDADQANPRS